MCIQVCLNYVNNLKLMILVHDVVVFNERYKIKLTNSTCILTVSFTGNYYITQVNGLKCDI